MASPRPRLGERGPMVLNVQVSKLSSFSLQAKRKRLNKVLVSDLPFKISFLLLAQFFHNSPSQEHMKERARGGERERKGRRGRRGWEEGEE